MIEPVDGYVPFDDAVRRVVDLAVSEADAERIVFEAIKSDGVRLRDPSGQEFRYKTAPEYRGFMGQVQARRDQGRNVGRYDPFTRSYPGAERLPPPPPALGAGNFRHYRVHLSDLRQVLHRERGLRLAEPASFAGRVTEPSPGFVPFADTVAAFEARLIPSPEFPRADVKSRIKDGILNESIRMRLVGAREATTWHKRRRSPPQSQNPSGRGDFDLWSSGSHFNLDDMGSSSRGASDNAWGAPSEFESPDYEYCYSDIEQYLENASRPYAARWKPPDERPPDALPFDQAVDRLADAFGLARSRARRCFLFAIDRGGGGVYDATTGRHLDEAQIKDRVAEGDFGFTGACLALPETADPKLLADTPDKNVDPRWLFNVRRAAQIIARFLGQKVPAVLDAAAPSPSDAADGGSPTTGEDAATQGKRKGGRPPKVDWEDIKDDAFAYVTGEGYSARPVDIVKLFRDFLEKQGLTEDDMPGETQLKKHAKEVADRVDRYLQREDKRSGRKVGN